MHRVRTPERIHTMKQSSFFVVNPLSNYIGSAVLFALLYVQAFQPELIPHESLPGFGAVYRYFAYEKPALALNLWYFLVGAHAFESVTAVVAALAKGVTNPVCLAAWFLQTAVNGWFSLRIVLFRSASQKPKRR